MGEFDRFMPELILLAFAGIVLLADFVVVDKRALAWLSILGLIASAGWTGWLVGGGRQGTAFSGTLVVDNFSLFFLFLFPAVAAMVVLSSIDFLRVMADREGEFYALVLVIAVGAMLLASANDLITIFVSLELTSISQYILAGFMRDTRSSEAGLKYLLLGAVSTAMLLYGMALLFGLTGTTSLPGIATGLQTASDNLRFAFLLAAALLAAGFGFKMAVFPFQMWVPDVYEGAPTPVTAYLSVASKAAAFAVVMRIFFTALSGSLITNEWANLFAALAAVSMTFGNVLAIQQRNIKRLFGYSSIAQAGYFMVGLAAVSAGGGRFSIGASGVIFFIGAYAFTNLGAFLAIIAISDAIGSEQIGDFAGMWRRSPWLALVLAFCLVSLTGIPPTAGFWAKLYIFNAAIQAKFVWLVIVAVINTLISAVYYLGVLRVMFLGEPAREGRLRAGIPIEFGMSLAALGVLFFGIVPQPLLTAAQKAADVFAH
ncbi:MAG TPA: NADH-quinone oxidoreductase subunit N [Dehalococcoidia bacterium]|nr:NADH-quinone oxidoreductase subunit N [Dehalococcoidia bacterium]